MRRGRGPLTQAHTRKHTRTQRPTLVICSSSRSSSSSSTLLENRTQNSLPSATQANYRTSTSSGSLVSRAEPLSSEAHKAAVAALSLEGSTEQQPSNEPLPKQQVLLGSGHPGQLQAQLPLPLGSVEPREMCRERGRGIMSPNLRCKLEGWRSGV